MKYIVNVQYTKFEFKNGTTALTFAELARAAVIGGVSVGIELENEEFEEVTEDDISEAFGYEEEDE